MTLVPSIAINQLLQPMRKLQTAEVTLINYLEGISQPINTTPTSLGEEDIIIALQELQKAPTDYVVQVLGKLAAATPPTQNDVLVAVNLVQTYLDMTSRQDGILTTLAEIDSSEIAGSANQYSAVQNARNALAKALVIIQTEPGLAAGEVDVEVLLQESKTILKHLKSFLDNSSDRIPLNQIVSQFVNHLGRARSIFSILSSEDATLTALQIPDIQQLIQNWETITGNLQTITAHQSPSELNTSRAAIAQSIQIHDRLEAVYEYLAEILRSNDLFNPAIL